MLQNDVSHYVKVFRKKVCLKTNIVHKLNSIFSYIPIIQCQLSTIVIINHCFQEIKNSRLHQTYKTEIARKLKTSCKQ